MESQGRRCNPELVRSCFFLKNPFQDVIYVQIDRTSHLNCVNGAIVPAHFWEIGLRPTCLFKYVFHCHFNHPTGPRAERPKWRRGLPRRSVGPLQIAVLWRGSARRRTALWVQLAAPFFASAATEERQASRGAALFAAIP